MSPSVLTLNCAPWHWVLLTPLVFDTEEVTGPATENVSNTNLIEQMSLEPLNSKLNIAIHYVRHLYHSLCKR